MTPDLENFRSLCTQGNLIPVYAELLSDMETPVSVFHRFCEDQNAFLLESVEGGSNWGRYSIIGIDPRAVFTVEGGKPFLQTPSGKSQLPGDGFAALRQVLAEVKPVSVPGLPRFFGGAVGYLSYETAGEFEKLPTPKADLGIPSSCFLLSDTLIIFDNVRHTMKLVACARIADFAQPEGAYRDACARIAALQQRLQQPMPPVNRPIEAKPVKPFASNMSAEQYQQMVRDAQKHIFAGDIIQAVLSQRFTTEMEVEPLTLYRALRLVNPSPYTFFVKLGNRILVGSSPEVMVRLQDGNAMVRPIAGTRKRGLTEQQDRELADELLQDPKERAEHVMLVDLGRNDLGRVAKPGTVRVKDFMTIEKYSHVQHIVSTVECVLRPEYDAIDLVKATFPAGTLSGAPKIRAMEIINGLEPRPRGVYGGAIGYIGYNGEMDLAITIRTLEVQGKQVSVQAGAGVVFDSIPEMEHQECLNKSAGMMKALELASRGLRLEEGVR